MGLAGVGRAEIRRVLNFGLTFSFGFSLCHEKKILLFLSRYIFEKLNQFSLNL